MDAFDIANVIKDHANAGNLYHEFFQAERPSLGLYMLTVGQADPQQPHTEDEVYYLVRGAGMIRVGDETRPVAAGSMVYVDERVGHRFHSITEDLTILVFFAPPRRSQKAT